MGSQWCQQGRSGVNSDSWLRGMSVEFWQNVVSMRWGHSDDNEQGLELNIDVLKITVVVSELAHQPHSAYEESGKISETWWGQGYDERNNHHGDSDSKCTCSRWTFSLQLCGSFTRGFLLSGNVHCILLQEFVLWTGCDVWSPCTKNEFFFSFLFCFLSFHIWSTCRVNQKEI